MKTNDTRRDKRRVRLETAIIVSPSCPYLTDAWARTALSVVRVSIASGRSPFAMAAIVTELYWLEPSALLVVEHWADKWHLSGRERERDCLNWRITSRCANTKWRGNRNSLLLRQVFTWAPLTTGQLSQLLHNICTLRCVHTIAVPYWPKEWENV